jgi:Fur family iron response transcriptional regulator
MQTVPTALSPSRQQVAQLLEGNGIAPTQQRIRVAEMLFARDQHLSAEQIIETLRADGARISKATVYNTLNLFAARGLVRQINIDATRACFDSNTKLHYHFHNVDTGELSDIGVPQIAFERMPELPPGTELAGIDIVVRVRRRS